ncbi:MAG: ATP synthase F1 subunit epsilon [Deltaproteobacteria bacterium]|nr:ATP synthase F1 subunit epsilon [Deltaproteobacteria bacterium]
MANMATMGPSDILTLEVATPTGLALKTDVSSVRAPSVEGEFGVLPGHLPLLASLKSGLLSYVADGEEKIVAVGPGFVETETHKVRILTDAFAAPEDIDIDAVKTELVEADARLRSFPEEHRGAAFAEVQRDVDWCHARLQAHALSHC